MHLYSKKQRERMRAMPHTKASIIQSILFVLIFLVAVAGLSWPMLAP